MENDKKEIRYIDLFGGVGGFRLGIERANSNKFDTETQNNNEKPFTNTSSGDGRGGRAYSNDSGRATNGEIIGQSKRIGRGRSQDIQKQWNRSISKRNNTKFNCVFYCDNDKYAVQTYNKNFGENWEATDIRTIKTDSIPDFDMLCAGFPCQAFSIAGKRKGFQDTRGTLFFEIARIIKAKRPKIVFLENVKGLLNHEKGKTFSIIIQTISELGYDVQWMVLNSKFFGVPQNRERVFIIGSLRETSRPEILPFRTSFKEDNGKRNGLPKGEVEVSYCLDSNYGKGTRDLSKCQRTMVFGESPQQHIPMRKEIDNKGRITERYDGISFTLSGSGRNSGRNLIVPQGQRVYSPNGVSKTLSDGGGQGAKTGLYAVTSVAIRNRNRSKHQNKEGLKYGDFDKAYHLEEQREGVSYTVKGATQEFMCKKGMKIRRLIPIECERLQGFPDNWTRGVSDTQRYKQMGNAVTVNVIQAIAENLK